MRRTSARGGLVALTGLILACGTRTGLFANSEPSDARDDIGDSGDAGNAGDAGSADAGEPTDAQGPDAVTDGAVPCVGTIPFAEVGPPITCRGEHEVLTCSGGTQYCRAAGGGPPPGYSSAQCLPLGCGCDNGASCDCVDASAAQGCSCSDEGGAVTVFCSVP
jgi:hypothetical protein